VPTSREPRSLEGLIRDILRFSKSRTAEPSVRSAAKYFSALSRTDYAAALRNQFDRQQIHEIIAELHRPLPALNRWVFAQTDLRQLARMATRFGVVVRPQSFDGPEGSTLRGFYVNDSTLLKGPMLYVNTANHPVAVAATFWHELGHHLTHQIFGGRPERLNLSFAANYEDHLYSPQEIVADIVMVLGGYPRPAAERLFGGSQGAKANHDLDWLVSKARPYVRSSSGFDFEKRFTAIENLYYLAGVIHVAKLRAALFSEYAI